MGHQDGGKIRVLVVDDTDVVRRGLSVALETLENIIIVGEASNGYEAVQLCNLLKPDIVLMDLVMPVMDGVTATEIIYQQCVDTKVLVLTSTTDMELVDRALEKGAVAYLLKTLSLFDLETAIHSVYRSELSPRP